MRNIIGAVVVLTMFFAVNVFADTKDNRVQVKSKGETLVKQDFGKDHIKVIIRTKEFHMPTVKREEAEKTMEGRACPAITTHKCSLVQDIVINIDNKSDIVPTSVFADLFNPDKVWIEKDNENDKLYVLVIKGGDAADSYTAKIKFINKDVVRVIYRIIIDEEADEPSEETFYHEVIIE